jgi:hypothetical protein
MHDTVSADISWTSTPVYANSPAAESTSAAPPHTQAFSPNASLIDATIASPIGALPD